MKSLIRIIGISILSAMLTFTGVACSRSPAGSREESQRVAEEFTRFEATFRFDGLPETLKVTDTTSIANGWRFTIEFDSQHAGYGNRSGQVLAQVITHHVAKVTVQSGKVTEAIMDEVWDMVNSRLLATFKIELAPIHEVNVSLMKSNPPQVGVYIKGGLRDGGTKFHDIEVTRHGNTVNIKVTTKRPSEGSFPAVYTYFEKNINLGSDFVAGTTYTIHVNDYTTTFVF